MILSPSKKNTVTPWPFKPAGTVSSLSERAIANHRDSAPRVWTALNAGEKVLIIKRDAFTRARFALSQSEGHQLLKGDALFGAK